LQHLFGGAPDISAEVVEVYRFTPENRERVLSNMAPEERSGAIQLPLFYVILVIPCICLVLLMLSCLKRFRSRRKTIWLLAVFLSVVDFAVYAYYDSGISIWTNIRIDLLLVYPALILNSAILITGIILLSVSSIKRNIKTEQSPAGDDL